MAFEPLSAVAGGAGFAEAGGAGFAEAGLDLVVLSAAVGVEDSPESESQAVHGRRMAMQATNSVKHLMSIDWIPSIVRRRLLVGSMSLPHGPGTHHP